MRPRSVATALLAILTAGCLGGGAERDLPHIDPVDVFWSERALPHGPPHDHYDVTQHANFTTDNFAILGHNPLVSPSQGRTPGGHFCGDAQTTTQGKRLAALEMRAVGGFALADVTDPTQPKWLGEFVMRNSRVYDMAVVPDGRHVLLVTTDAVQGLPAVPVLASDSSELYWRDACRPDALVRVGSAAEDPLPRPMAFILVSIENPANPTIVDQRPIPRAGHSVYATILDGRTLVMLSVYGFSSQLGPGDYYQFYEIVTTAAGARLQLLSTQLVKAGTGPAPSLIRVHDGWIHKHPATGKTVAYGAGGADFFIFDLTDPRSPRVLGTWTDVVQPAKAYMGSLHSVYPMPELWDGRHYTLLGPEFGGRPGERPSGTLWLLDTTDPGRIREVGAWTLPHDVTWEAGGRFQYLFSNHYFAAVGRTAFISMYHGGVWAVDLSTVRPDAFTLLPSIGVFAPSSVSEKPPATLLRYTPNFQEVFAMPDGSLVTFEGASGLYAFRFNASAPMPPPVPWPIDPVTPR